MKRVIFILLLLIPIAVISQTKEVYFGNTKYTLVETGNISIDHMVFKTYADQNGEICILGTNQPSCKEYPIWIGTCIGTNKAGESVRINSKGILFILKLDSYNNPYIWPISYVDK